VAGRNDDCEGEREKRATRFVLYQVTVKGEGHAMSVFLACFFSLFFINSLV
jgi:hypothetical protein